MVALTARATLSLVMTSWRSPVLGVSRMSTLISWSRNGTTMARPGPLTVRNWPSRLTTPTLPCWMTLTVLASRISASTARTTPTTTPTISHLLLLWPHHQGGASYCHDGHGGVGAEPLGVVGHGQPPLPPVEHVAGVVLVADPVQREGALAHHRRAGGQAGVGTVAADRAHEKGPQGPDPGHRERPGHDQLAPQRAPQPGDQGGHGGPGSGEDGEEGQGQGFA